MEPNLDAHCVQSLGVQPSDADTRRDVPKELIPWTRTLKNSIADEETNQAQTDTFDIDMTNSSVRPPLLVHLSNFTSRLNVPLVRIW